MSDSESDSGDERRTEHTVVDTVTWTISLPTVLKAVINSINSCEELKTARQVCKEWKWESELSQWSKVSTIRLNDVTIPEISLQLQIPLFFNARFGTFGMAQVYPFSANNEGSAFIWERILRNCRFVDARTTPLSAASGFTDGFAWILNQCPYLKELHIVPVIAKEDSRSPLFGLPQRFPICSSLRSLRLDFSIFLPQRNNESIFTRENPISPGIAKRMFAMMPNLNKLTLSAESYAEFVLACLSDPWRNENEPFSSPILLNSIVILPVHFRRSSGIGLDSLASYLELVNPPLNNLKIRTYCVKPVDRPFQDIPVNANFIPKIQTVLQSVASSVEDLEIYVSRVNGNLNNPLVLYSTTFLSLKRLIITLDQSEPGHADQGWILPDLKIFIENLIPKIELFQFKNEKRGREAGNKRRLAMEEVFGTTGFTIVLFTSLSNLYLQFNFTKKVIRLFGKLFPNMKVLHLVLDPTNVELPMQIWPKLEKLVILQPGFVYEAHLDKLRRAFPNTIILFDDNQWEIEDEEGEGYFPEEYEPGEEYKDQDYDY